MNSKAICWLDLETTGLDATKDDILEVAIILTNWDLQELNRKSWVVKHDLPTIESKMVPFVKRMHKDNGLLEDIKVATLSLAEVEIEVLRFLQPHFERSAKFVVGGSSVHFDRKYIEVHMPILDMLLHHRLLDVTGIGLFAERWTPNHFEEVRGSFGPDSQNGKKTQHRALNDIEKSLKYAKQYKDRLFIDKVLPPPSVDIPLIIKETVEAPQKIDNIV